MEKPIIIMVKKHLVSGEEDRELSHFFMLLLGPDKHHQLEKLSIDGAIAKSSAFDQKAVEYAVESVEKAKDEGLIFGDLLTQKKTAKKMEEEEGKR